MNPRRFIPLSLVILLTFVPIAQAGNVLVYSRLCLDTTTPTPGQCVNADGPIAGATVTASGSVTGSYTTDSNGFVALNIVSDGTAYLNTTLSGYRQGPTVPFFATQAVAGPPSVVNVYVYLTAGACSPSNQTITVPAFATWTYTIQNPSAPIFFTVLRQNGGQLSPVTSTQPFGGVSGSVNYPFGGFPTDNGATTLHNDTGSYALVLTDSRANVVTYCSLQINSGGVVNSAITLYDSDNATIANLLSRATQEALTAKPPSQDQPTDFGALLVSLTLGRPYWFPNVWYWIAGLVGVAFVVAPIMRGRRDTMEDGQ